MSEEAILLCIAVLDSPEPSVGRENATAETCSGCGCEVWVSKASYANAAKEHTVILKCSRCFMQQMQDEEQKDMKFEKPSAEQIAEMKSKGLTDDDIQRVAKMLGMEL